MNMDMLSLIAQKYQSLFGDFTSLVFAPGRANIIGEHTDYNDGYVFPFAIANGLFFAMGPSNENTSQIYANDVKEHWSIDLNNQSVPYHWCNYIVQVLRAVNYKGPQFNVVFGGDLPSGAGISSSSALTCGFLYALSNFASLGLNNKDLLHYSVLAERGSGVRGGKMDQFTIINGIEDHAILLDCRDMYATYVNLDPGYFKFMLVHTHKSHTLACSEYNQRREECDNALQIIQKHIPAISSLRDLSSLPSDYYTGWLNPTELKRVRHVVDENERVVQMAKAIRNKDLWLAGSLLYQSHQSLSLLYEVSSPELDFLVQWASGQGNIYGARMMGGGFGGCTINLIQDVLPKAQEEHLFDVYFQEFGIYPECIYISPCNGMKSLL